MPPVQPLVPPPNGVTVRMYRQGDGDCFLLAFSRQGGGTPYDQLSDCEPVNTKSLGLLAARRELALAAGGKASSSRTAPRPSPPRTSSPAPSSTKPANTAATTPPSPAPRATNTPTSPGWPKATPPPSSPL